ncbi:class I SAM-dependent methyltransferase [Paractinoplanes hotanensis]|uniref:Class I SAM-dependent methyltransferase n=1 Tax=Paractinoplanes hotanensis TaxID=2906497 RepID=A0ABT0XRG0_9ACTN|nr:class I SAM-dependent methyltransferase [Actinoplanes hotanensis]MCM4076363.1 class I SAM-dependent methyltransferase [Actinoplanes hotanensis]
MDTTTTDLTGQLVDRLFSATVSALELCSIYLGVELGLYRALSRDGALTAAELSARAGIASRYAVEWLEQQAVAGLLTVDQPAAPGSGADAGDRRYRLDPEHARVLVDVDDPAHVAPFAHLLAGIGSVLPAVAAAYREGGGVAYAAYGPAFRYGQGHINRPAFTHQLPAAWLGAMPDVVSRLESASRPRIADVGCGQGWSVQSLARAFPRAWVDGIDADSASIHDARRNAADAGLDGRVRFVHADVARAADEGPYDLVLFLEALHDMPQPVEALRATRAALAPDGVVLIVDERVADRFTAPGTEVERMMYGWSVTHCLPSQLADRGSVATGTVLRPGTLHRWAAQAGFTRSVDLPVQDACFRLYRLER